MDCSPGYRLSVGQTRLLCPWDSPDKNTGVGCHFLLQGIFPNPGVEPTSPVWQAVSFPLCCLFYRAGMPTFPEIPANRIPEE